MPPPAPEMRTQRLILRRFWDGDRSTIAQMDGDPRVMRYIGLGETFAGDAAEERWRRLYSPRSRPGGAIGFWAVAFERAPAAMLGWVCLTVLAPKPVLELGYRFPAPLWGRSIAREACEPLLHRAFVELDQDRICAVIDPRNRRSHRLALRLGFAYAGERWLPCGRYADYYHFPRARHRAPIAVAPEGDTNQSAIVKTAGGEDG